MWKQRSKVNQVKVGDCNIAYFHKMTSARLRYNIIHSIKVEGSQITSISLSSINGDRNFSLNNWFGGDNHNADSLEPDFFEVETKGATRDLTLKKEPVPDILL